MVLLARPAHPPLHCGAADHFAVREFWTKVELLEMLGYFLPGA
jgi:hypothetical protein